jgi:hypothetical protein
VPRPEDVTLLFGKYRGLRLGDVARLDPSYVDWLAYRAERIRQPFVQDAARVLGAARRSRRSPYIAADSDSPAWGAAMGLAVGQTRPGHLRAKNGQSNCALATASAVIILAICVLISVGTSLAASRDDRVEAARGIATSIQAQSDRKLLFVDDFEGDSSRNWSFSGFGAFHPTAGVGHSGQYAIYAGDPIRRRYQPGTNTTAEMRVLVEVPNNGLTFLSWVWRGGLDCGTRGFGADWLTAEISSDLRNWQEVWRNCASSSSWRRTEIEMASFRGMRAAVRFRFVETGRIESEGPYIDDVRFEYQPGG